MSSSSVSLGRNLVSLKWEEFNIFLVSELASLYQKDDLTDVTLFCEGRSFRAHKVLLSLWSTYFRDVFRGTSHSHPVVILKETNSSDLELILRFIYQGHLLIPIEETDRFLKTAEHFQVAGLKNMRNHVPNFTYNSGNGSAAYHEDTAGHQQQPPPPPQQQQQASMYEVGTSGGSSILASPQTTVHHGSHFRASGSTNPPPSQPSSSSSATTITLGVQPPTITSHTPVHASLSSSSPMDTSPSNHHSSLDSSNQHQVIRQGQGSIQRSIKHVAPQSSTPSGSVSYSSNAVGFQPTSAAGAVSSSASNNGSSGGGGGVGVVTRLSSESVIYQPQPVLIFQNGPQQSVPIIKSGEQQYIARSITGESSRSEHSMMVIEGVVGDGQVHLEPSSSNHGTGGTTSYTVYAHPSLTPPPNPPQQLSNSHHSSPDQVPSGSGEEILGLPSYSTSSPTSQAYSHHAREVITVDDTAMSSQTHPHSHHHAHHIQHISSHDPHPPEPEPATVVVSHSYTSSSTSSYEQSPLQNGSNSNSNSTVSSINSQTSSSSSGSNKTNKLTTTTTVVEQPTVYAVKRIPPPLPPSSPPPQTSSRNFKGIPTIKSNISSVKGKSIQVHHHSNQVVANPAAAVVTATKSSSAIVVSGGTSTGGDGGKMVAPNSSSSRSSHAINPSTSNAIKIESASSSKSYPHNTSCSSTTSSPSTRKVVLVPCPKCGKKVKQTSLKVHMKRTHLEEGTVLVCPICSKRISSKGVYYKHMYIHRKRSEMASKSPTAIIKTETQGT